MRLLLDANLSWRMIAVLQQHFMVCLHVDRVKELEIPASDTAIWHYARVNDLIIITNDEDYVDLINLRGFPPKVVLLRVGNNSRLFISNLLIARKNDIEKLHASTENGLLEIVGNL